MSATNLSAELRDWVDLHVRVAIFGHEIGRPPVVGLEGNPMVTLGVVHGRLTNVHPDGFELKHNADDQGASIFVCPPHVVDIRRDDSDDTLEVVTTHGALAIGLDPDRALGGG